MGRKNGEPMRGIKEDALEATSQGAVLTDRQQVLGCAVVWARANIKHQNNGERARERSERGALYEGVAGKLTSRSHGAKFLLTFLSDRRIDMMAGWLLVRCVSCQASKHEPGR
jgi:hypothetical protein